MADAGIDEARNADGVEQVADETGAPDHCARGNGGAGIGESKLEDPDGQEHNACGIIGFWCALQEEPVVANESVAVAEHESKADSVEQDAA